MSQRNTPQGISLSSRCYLNRLQRWRSKFMKSTKPWSMYIFTLYYHSVYNVLKYVLINFISIQHLKYVLINFISIQHLKYVLINFISIQHPEVCTYQFYQYTTSWSMYLSILSVYNIWSMYLLILSVCNILKYVLINDILPFSTKKPKVCTY